MSTLKISAAIEVKPEYKDEMYKILCALVDESRKEEGCVSYNLHESIENPLKLIILEEWKNQEAIDTHNATPHFQSFVAAIKGKIEKLTIDIVKQVY